MEKHKRLSKYKPLFLVFTDINDDRLKFAAEHGADLTINVMDKTNSEIANHIQEFMKEGPSAIIECSGAISSYNIGILVSMILCLLIVRTFGPSKCLSYSIWNRFSESAVGQQLKTSFYMQNL